MDEWKDLHLTYWLEVDIHVSFELGVHMKTMSNEIEMKNSIR